jgi:hypothetical protein
MIASMAELNLVKLVIDQTAIVPSTTKRKIKIVIIFSLIVLFTFTPHNHHYRPFPRPMSTKMKKAGQKAEPNSEGSNRNLNPKASSLCKKTGRGVNTS